MRVQVSSIARSDLVVKDIILGKVLVYSFVSRATRHPSFPGRSGWEKFSSLSRTIPLRLVHHHLANTSGYFEHFGHEMVHSALSLVALLRSSIHHPASGRNPSVLVHAGCRTMGAGYSQRLHSARSSGIECRLQSANAYARRRKWAAVLLYTIAAIAPLLVILFWTALSVGFVVVSNHLPFAQVISFFYFAIVGLAFTCTVSWSLLGSALAFTIVSSEDEKLKSVWQRTYELMRNYMWRGGSFVVLLGVTLFVVTGALDLPLLLASLFDAWRNSFAADYDMPWYLEALSALVDCIINTLLLAVVPIANALYYNDLRLRVEGRDIILRLEKLENLGSA